MDYSHQQIDKIQKLEGQRCTECTQKVEIYTYKMTGALLRALEVLIRHVETSAINWCKTSDLPFTRTQYTNWTKLKYWGLIAHSDDELRWCVTHLGMSFYYGHTAIRKTVKRYDNHTWPVQKDDRLVYSYQIDPTLSFQDSWIAHHEREPEPQMELPF